MSAFVYADRYYNFKYRESSYEVRRTYDRGNVCITNRFRFWGKKKYCSGWVVIRPEADLREALIAECTD